MLHAYSRVYAHDRPSSRIKDLVDMALIVSDFSFNALEVKTSIQQTLEDRGFDSFPEALAEPPKFWETGYRKIATEIEIDPDIAVGHRLAAAFFDPLLAGSLPQSARWTHKQLCWTGSD